MTNLENKTLISYALATEHDAITMYKFMLKNLPDAYREDIEHILREEEEHAEMLEAMLEE